MLSQFKKNSTFRCHIVLLIMLFMTLHSQEVSNQYNLELNPNLSNQWWSQYNNYGQEPSEVRLDYKTIYKNEKVNFNLKVFISKNKIYVGESFVQSKLFDNTYLKVGKYYKDFSSYLNETLSSGSLLISNNAEPMPKISLLSSYRFKQSQNVDFNFGISHGVFAKSTIYKTAPMLHEKFVYLNYSKNKNQFSIGFVHEAMWGGSTEKYGDFPNSFEDFFKILISADGPFLEGETHANALGNHLGIWDFYYKRKRNNKELKLYYQHFFEDTSGLRFWNRLDGLWGVEFSDHIKNTNILFEYLNTENQDRDPPYVNENYYNHSQYISGWSYKGYTLGNPFINHLEVNPIEVIHIGIKGEFSSIYSYSAKLSKLISENDFIKYKLSMKREINNQTAIQFDLINHKESIGLQVSLLGNI